MPRGSIPPVTEALKTFKRATNISTLRIIARQLNENFGLSLRMGHIRLHEGSSGQIQEALSSSDLPMRVLISVFEDAAAWHKANHQDVQAFEFEVRDLLAISARKINLSRDLEQVAQMQQLIQDAAVYRDLDIKVTFTGTELQVLGQNPQNKAHLLVGLRAICGTRDITIPHILEKLGMISEPGTYPVEEIDNWLR